jgi:hypothetical protein
MPEQQPNPGTLTAELVLAALERAERHRYNPAQPGVLLATVKEHLDLPRHGGSTRRLRPTWDALAQDALIEQTRRHGLILWALTRGGRRRIARARRNGRLPELPESPQHRAWREAQRAAGEHLSELVDEVRDCLAAAIALLDSEPRESDPWYALGEQLKTSCERLGSATHCLYEWVEPDDAQADVTPDRYRGRRNYWQLVRSSS